MDTKLASEMNFHDDWAKQENVGDIDINLVNEAITSPELRYIHKELGDIKGKKILDVGCGLGEVSVYFASRGASVVATDLSPEMCDFANQLAQRYNLKIRTIVGNAEDFNYLNQFEKFDIIYCGNLLHHVDIKKTVLSLKSHLNQDGIFASWDPIKYNPIINIYRFLASKVRTVDEQPLSYSNIKFLRSEFKKNKTNYFWLTTQLIFILMFILEFKNPSKVRYWKDVVYNQKKWGPIYSKLLILDSFFYKIFPFTKLLSWNVVFIGEGVRKQ